MSNSHHAFAQSWYEEVWNLGDETAIDRMMSPSARFHGLLSQDSVPGGGAAAFKPFVRELRRAIPDIRIEVLRSVSEGDTVASYCKVTGNYTGGGGRDPIEVYGIGMAVLSDGQIQESWNCFDFMTLYQQMGLLPRLPA